MDRDDIIRIARAAGLVECLTTDESVDGEGGVWFYDDNYIKQVELFFRAAYAAGAAAEREACEKVADAYEPRCDVCPRGVAAAIRARGEK